MFADQKKDFYSVNADIAIEANQQQRNFEYSQRAGMIQQEYATMGMGNNFEDSQNQTQDGLDQQYGMDGMQQEMMQQQHMQLVMLDETMNGPQAVRYDEVYYPRTDKRSISKYIKSSAQMKICCNAFVLLQRETSTPTKEMNFTQRL